MLGSFLLSAAAHELVMAVVTKMIRCAPAKPHSLFICEKIDLFERGNRLYIFVLQLIQIPMVAVARSLAIKRREFFGNAMIWLTLYAGFPLLCIAYVFY
jgi:sterol O-acyltransferase